MIRHWMKTEALNDLHVLKKGIAVSEDGACSKVVGVHSFPDLIDRSDQALFHCLILQHTQTGTSV